MKENKNEKPFKNKESKEKRKRSDSPCASQDDIKSKEIELIIYVENLPITWKEEDIRTFFEEFGKILEVKLIRKSGTFTGSSLVKFASLSKAEYAIKKLNNTLIPGANGSVNMKWLYTEEQRLNLGQNDNHKLFVGSLPR